MPSADAVGISLAQTGLAIQKLAESPSSGPLEGRPLALAYSALLLSGLYCDGLRVLGSREGITTALQMGWITWRDILWSSGCDEMISLYVLVLILVRASHQYEGVEVRLSGPVARAGAARPSLPCQKT
jgi:hypothetical protein